MTKTYKFIYTFISLHLVYMVYQIFQSHKEKRMHTSLDKTSNTEFHTEHILSSLKGYSIPGQNGNFTKR